MKARAIALVALSLGLAVGLQATVATTTRPNSAPAQTVADDSKSLPTPLTSAAPSKAGPGGCCV